MIGPSPYYMNEPGYHGGFDKADIGELLDMMEVNYKEWAKYLAPVAMGNEDRPELAEHIRERVELHEWPYQPITVSIGVAVLTAGNSLSELLQHADAALYNSKNAGRNRVTVAS